ncbi:uncharacterized protein LOC103191498 [Callorhinchus milii]|uniref:uncharacterized protein LOC103191498 n=1 Tax=Callorhinchus milii TaxID=7868 RepID=UPI001C3FC26F|nr:uncharacterized protein LOC103191498 [Callorhinchus milii]
MGEVGAAGLGRDPGVSPLPASMEEESAEGSGGAGRRVGGDGMFSPPSSLKSGGIKVSLKKWSIWDKFYNLGTEMRMSKRGRFMFPYCEYSVSGLDPDRNYIMAMDISPVDTFRYRYNGCKWQINGKATAHVIGRLYFHPNGSVCGREWMAKPMSFAKLRLTNCPSAEEGHAILHSMHRYVPQLHIIVADGIVDQQDLNDRRVYAFIFQQTEFFAVTKYENKFIRQLKHFYNPYGTALRDVKACKQGGVTNRRARKQNDKINPFRDCEAKIQDSLKREESMKGLKDIVPLEDCSAKIEDAINNQGPRKTFPKIMPFENAVNVTQTFSFEAGIKLDELKPDEWLSLKYSEMLPGGQDPQSLQSESHGIRDTGIPFVSRTGKTNDLTKIKGWKNKFNLQSGSSDDKTSPPPASASCPAAIKNRSAFVSDLLDEYLEKEGKIIEQQGLLHEYENSEIEPPTLKPEGQRHVTFSPEATKPRSRKALNVEMSPVLEKHFRVTNKGIFIRDIRGAGTGKKVRRPGPKRGNSVGRRSKTSRQPGEALGKSEEAKLGNAHTTSSPKKLSSSPSLKIIQAEPGPRGGKGPVIPGNQTAATFNSGYTSAEEEEPQTLNRSGGDSEAQTPVEASSRLQLPPATNRSAGSKTVEIVSYCSWSQSRVRIIKLIAEHTMANRLPCTQQLGCYSVRLERGEVLGSGPTLAREAPPRRVVHARVTIRNAESVLEKPTVQTMVIEAMVGTSAFRTKLNHLISKVSKNSSEQVNMEPIRSPIQVVMNSEKAAPSSVYSPSETSCPTNQLSRLIAQDRDKVLPTTPTQRRELPLLVHTTGRETPKIPPSCIRSTAAATFQRIGTSCALVNSDIIPSSAIPVSSQSQADTSSTPSAPNLLGDSISPGLLTGSAEVLDRDGRRFCVAIPKALKLQPGDNLLLQPYTASDGRQLYKHSSGKLFQLVCAKAPEQTEQAGGPDHIPETSPLVDAHTPTISASTNCANGLHAATGAKTFHTSHSFPDGGSSEPPGVAEPLYKIVTLNPKPYPSPSSLPAWKSPDATPNSLDGFPHITSSLQATRLPNGAGESVPLAEQRANQQSRQPGTQAQVSRFPGLLKSGQSLGNWNQESEMEGSLVAAMAEERGGRTETRVERDPSPNNEMIAVKKDISEISAHRQLDPHGPEICTVTIKEEPVEEEEDAFAFGGSDFRTRSGFNFNVRPGAPKPWMSWESFYGSQGLKLPSKRKVRGVSEQGRARKNAMLHNLRERESRRMMEHRFKTLKKKLFDEQQTASKGAILDEAIDTISNLDKESKQLLLEKEELLGKQKVLLEKISLLSEIA